MSPQPIRILFHAGFHKTGTTSLQASLAAHAAWLAPDILVETRALSKRLAVAADAARRYSERLTATGLQALHSDLADWAAALPLRLGQTLVVSSEDFAGHMPGNLKIRDYSAAIPIATAIATVLHRQFGATLDLTLLYTTRDPEPWIRSIHWQLAKHHRPDISIGTFTRLFGSAADFAPLIAAIRAAVPGAKVADAALERMQSLRLGPAGAIYDLLRLDASLQDTLPPKPPSNQSPPYDLAEAFMALNRVGMPRATLTRVKRAILGAVEADRDNAGRDKAGRDVPESV